MSEFIMLIVLQLTSVPKKSQLIKDF